MINESTTKDQRKETVKTTEPFVAISVPVYNGGKFLAECLESIMNQSYQNWECVVLDNNSSDDTNSIARSFADRDSRFKLYRNDSLLPLMENWNRAFELSNKEADYFKIVPADDWLFTDFLSESVSLMESYPEVGVCSSFRLDGTRVRGSGMDFYKGPVIDGKWVINKQLLVCVDLTGSANTVLFRSSALRAVESYPMIFNLNSLHADTELAYDVLLNHDFGFVYKVLSFTRRHEESITSEISSKLDSSICFRDNQMVKYADIIDNFAKRYKEHRVFYAVLILKRMLRFKWDALRYQNRNLGNKLGPGEMLKALVVYLPFYKYRRPCPEGLSNMP